MTTEVKTHTIALIGGPLNAHVDGEHVCRTIDRIDEEGLPERITATPVGLFFDLDVPANVGRYERDPEGRTEDPVQPEAVYRWLVPSAGS